MCVLSCSISSSKDFAKAIKRTRGHASTALNVLLAVGAVERIGKDKNAYLYKITNKDE